MFIDMIGKATAKAVISAQELANFGLDYEKIREDEPHTRGLVIYIIGELMRITGADITDRELYIEVFPAEDGGCLMYISDSRGKDLLTEPADGNVKHTAPRRRRKAFRRDRPEDLPLPETVFSCRSAQELSECAALLIRHTGKYIRGSSLYFSHGDFRLIVTAETPSGDIVPPFSVTAAYTREHYALLLPEKALEILLGFIP